MKTRTNSIKKLSMLSLFLFAAVNSSISFSNIVLEEFKAMQHEKEIQITWTTSSEKDLMLFTLERSADAYTFEELADVNSTGNNNDLRNYTITDFSPVYGTAYYRLKSTTINGDVTYSDLISIEYEAGSSELVLYPNPGDGRKLEINFFTKKHREAKIAVINSIGAVIYNETWITQNQGNNTFCLIPYDQLVKGVYFIELEVNGEKRQQKFIVY